MTTTCELQHPLDSPTTCIELSPAARNALEQLLALTVLGLLGVTQSPDDGRRPMGVLDVHRPNICAAIRSFYDHELVEASRKPADDILASLNATAFIQ